MSTFLVIIHVMACVGLIVIVLIQRGRGSGLVESLAGVESMFGTKTNEFLTRATPILSVLFFFTCLGLALSSVKQNKSLMSDIKPKYSVDKNASKNEMPKKAVTVNEPLKQESTKATLPEQGKAENEVVQVQTQTPQKEVPLSPVTEQKKQELPQTK